MQVATVRMVMFVWWEAPINMRVEWRCASMTSGGQCVMTCGTVLMLLWSAGSCDIHTLEVSVYFCVKLQFISKVFLLCHFRWCGIQQCLLWCWQWTNCPR